MGESKGNLKRKALLSAMEKWAAMLKNQHLFSEKMRRYRRNELGLPLPLNPFYEWSQMNRRHRQLERSYREIVSHLTPRQQRWLESIVEKKALTCAIQRVNRPSKGVRAHIRANKRGRKPPA